MGSLCSGLHKAASEHELNDLIEPSKHRTDAGRARAKARKDAQEERASTDQAERQLDALKAGTDAAILLLKTENDILKEQMKKKDALLAQMEYLINYNEVFKEETQRITGRLDEIKAVVNARFDGKA
jgi:DNA repair exonuclease SbcCD ATPase subunit